MIKSTYQKLGQLANFLLKPLTRTALNRTTRTRIIILSGSQTVLVKNWLGKGHWGLSGGGIARSETAENCVIREVKEEIGLDINLQDLQYLGQKAHPKTDQNLHFKIDYFFIKLNNKPNLKVKRPWEVTEAGWFDINNLPKQISQVAGEAIKLANQAGLLP